MLQRLLDAANELRKAAQHAAETHRRFLDVLTIGPFNPHEVAALGAAAADADARFYQAVFDLMNAVSR